eukprot:TRINITY_DN21597_c0_g1_i1.p1 TRINITY_DN21597_c0_g1~~TRINITY_DN21597_c0_g1_i1.p1  ORF type:complete len:301 (+),score=54.61 TRINITY_DN21597_c0_g1_i1:48-905(+)
MAAVSALGLTVSPLCSPCPKATNGERNIPSSVQLCSTAFFRGHMRSTPRTRRHVAGRMTHLTSGSVVSGARCDAGGEEPSQPAWKTAFGLTAAALLLSSGLNEKALADDDFKVYYGTAASASSYGGYGGNASKQDSAEYIYDVPSGWKERAISKVEKGTNGTDSEFYNPKKKTEKVYVTFLSGFRRLAPQDIILNNLALSDVSLQDAISSADRISQTTRETDGQVYYDYEIDSPLSHQLIAVTCAKNKLYAQFVSAPVSDWNRDSSTLQRVHSSFKTVGINPLGM